MQRMLMKDFSGISACIFIKVDKDMNINISRQIVFGSLERDLSRSTPLQITKIYWTCRHTFGRPSVANVHVFVGVMQKMEKMILLTKENEFSLNFKFISKDMIH